jgi:hypothetical protein
MCDEQGGFYKQHIPLSGASETYPRTVSGSLSVGDIHGHAIGSSQPALRSLG